MPAGDMQVDVLESPPPRSLKAGTWNWSVRAIRWRAVFEFQNWGSIPLMIPALVMLALAHFSFQQEPRYRPAYLYDARIGNPHVDDTVPNEWVVVFPWLAMLVSIITIEFGLYYQQQSITAATAAAVHILWSCLVNFFIVLAVSEVTKAVTGSLRPNFLARCQPDPAQLAQPFSFQEPVRCTNPDTDEVNQGRLSFVSGHASNTLAVSWFTTMYLVWSLYWREGAPYASQVFGGGRLRRLVFELLYAFLYWWLLFCLLLSWFSSCTRVWDNEHSEADILGGLMIALLLTTPFVIKTLGQYAVFKRELDIHHETTMRGVQRLAEAEGEGKRSQVMDGVLPALAITPAAASAHV